MSGEDGDSPQSPTPHGLSHCRAALGNGDGSIQRKADHNVGVNQWLVLQRPPPHMGTLGPNLVLNQP